MAERIVSPGVFTQETDLSYLPQGVANIGAAMIGPTQKGPAFVPTIITSGGEFEERFGKNIKTSYVPFAVQEYLKSASSVTVVRIMHTGGYKADYINVVISGSLQSGEVSGSSAVVFTLSNTRLGQNIGIASSVSASASAGNNTFDLQIIGAGGTHQTFSTLSLDSGSANYFAKKISSDPLSNTDYAYLYKAFHTSADNCQFDVDALQVTGSASASAGLDFSAGNNGAYTAQYDAVGNSATWGGNVDYCVARTPYIIDQGTTDWDGSTDVTKNLFRVYTLGHGSNMNTEYKVGISNIRAAGSIPGSDYGDFTFSIIPLDGRAPETWENCDFNPDSPNYFAKQIGDAHIVVDANGRLTYHGTHPNRSKWCRVGDFQNIENYPKSVVPYGYAAVENPVPGGTIVPSASMKLQQVDNTNQQSFQASAYHGFDFMDIGTANRIRGGYDNDGAAYLSPIPSGTGNGSNKAFSLNNMYGHANADTLPGNPQTTSGAGVKITLALSDIGQRRFAVPFQWGFDGVDPASKPSMDNDITTTNVMGFDCSTSTTSGTTLYKRAINTISNPDEFDINMLVIPGILHSKDGGNCHNNITEHAITKVEERADCFYIMDGFHWADTISQATSALGSLDTNYAATYYPWVQVNYAIGDGNVEPTWIPPSVALAGVFAFNDRIGQEWFAPAGLNRGGLTITSRAKFKLNHAERDKLYEERINPIATFPGQGPTVFGQKTLQSKPSALDRINVRRLLINVKKFIASTSKFLVFEQNTTATRNRFLNTVNPYLENVQANSGLNAFRVVMDESNNTPDEIDRNRLVGQIFVQPTRTAEFIVLDFVVQPTGATFTN
jgi:hypothetical protein